jgi:hypothetical protein
MRPLQVRRFGTFPASTRPARAWTQVAGCAIPAFFLFRNRASTRAARCSLIALPGRHILISRSKLIWRNRLLFVSAGNSGRSFLLRRIHKVADDILSSFPGEDRVSARSEIQPATRRDYAPHAGTSGSFSPFAALRRSVLIAVITDQRGSSQHCEKTRAFKLHSLPYPSLSEPGRLFM